MGGGDGSGPLSAAREASLYTAICAPGPLDSQHGECEGTSTGWAEALSYPPARNLTLALRELGRLPGVTIAATSAVYLTEPQEFADQPWYANQCAALELEDFDLETGPQALLDALLAIETDLGRVRHDTDDDAPPSRRFGPRRIDIDLLHIDGVRSDTPSLTLPHPRMHGRAFVLLPLRDIAPDLRIPMPDGEATTIDNALKDLDFEVTGCRVRQPARENRKDPTC